MRFLVIGASGFVGRNLMKHFQASGYEVLGTQSRDRGGHLIRFDLLSDRIVNCLPRAFLESDERLCVVIAAVISNMDQCFLEREMSRRVNVDNTIQLIEDLKGLNVKVVFLSSCFVFDGTVGYYNEDHPLSPVNEYGRHKAEVEHYLQRNAPSAFIARLDKIVGDDPGDRQLFAQWYELRRQGRPIVCLEGSLLSPTYVKDVARAVEQAFERDMKGVFHVANSEFFYRDELARQFCFGLGFDPQVITKSLSEFSFPDRRALKSYLDGSRFSKATEMRFTPMRDVFTAFKSNVQRGS